MHRPLFLVAAASVAAVGGLIAASALPAGAATSVRAETMARTAGLDPSADTPVTFTVTTTGTLAITAPVGSVDLGTAQAIVSGTGSPTIIGSASNFGLVTVTDTRGLDPAAWTATVSSTDFTNTSITGTAPDIIPATDATYLTGALGTVSGLPLSTTAVSDTNDTGTPPGIGLKNTAQDVVTMTSYDGDNAATWNPEISVAIPAATVIGTYDGTVTHSVT